ncbi:hypothetical protein POTOM_019732 [Populus tomentosa]|uniref:Protein kinase domain-containing protein n=1 Tax=Populus tomentosa TaxID=118781 RepID=A0A8X8CUF8_POPTO|nr:hypothetical protein POTOM_019732 [Populus tomentosa]
MEDPLGRDPLAGLHKPEQPTRKYNGGRRAVSGEERKLKAASHKPSCDTFELLLGATDYVTGIDLWSAGCLLAEMFAGKPSMPGSTEVEHLHRTFKLCGTPSQDYWKKLQLSTFRPPRTYKTGPFEAFRTFPEIALGLLTTTFLALGPISRGCASSALQNEGRT